MAEMKLSGAIRKGAKKRPQGFGDLFTVKHNLKSTKVASCAIGAACEAFDPEARLHPEAAFHDLKARFPPLAVGSLDRFTCPVPRCWEVNNLFGVITHLNDCHRWARERIAEYVATIEPATPQTGASPST